MRIKIYVFIQCISDLLLLFNEQQTTVFNDKISICNYLNRIYIACTSRVIFNQQNTIRTQSQNIKIVYKYIYKCFLSSKFCLLERFFKLTNKTNRGHLPRLPGSSGRFNLLYLTKHQLPTRSSISTTAQCYRPKTWPCCQPILSNVNSRPIRVPPSLEKTENR